MSNAYAAITSLAAGGLGVWALALVKSFIELHDGQVTLDSQPGAGTRVTCVLPIREEAALSGDRLKANAG